MKIEKED